jgi:hypothetical protein
MRGRAIIICNLLLEENILLFGSFVAKVVSYTLTSSLTPPKKL